MSEADYLKILEYIALNDKGKVVKHNERIYIIPIDEIVDDQELKSYRSASTAKAYFDRIHAYVSNNLKFYSNSLWHLSPEELLVQADLDINV